MRHAFGMSNSTPKDPQAGGVLYTGPSLGKSLAGLALVLLRSDA
jgi:hypothetical protein